MKEATWKGNLESIIENIVEGIVVLNSDGIIVLANAAAERILGRSKSDIIGRAYKDKVWDFTTAQGVPTPTEELGFIRVMRTRKPVYAIEHNHIRPDGSKITLSVNAAPLLDGTDTLIGVLISFTDITKRKQAEQLLRESEERYRLLVELSPDGIAVHTDGRLVYLNPAGARIFGYGDPREPLGLPIIGFVHPSYRELVIKRQARMQTGELAPPLEEKFIRVNGEPIDVEVVAAPIIYNGRPSIQVVFRDISARKKAEASLQETNQMLQAIFQESPLAIVVTDLYGKVKMWNPGAEHMLGWKAGEVIGHPFPADSGGRQDEIRALFERAMHGNALTGIEIKRKRRDGAAINVSVSVAPLFNAAGNITGVMSILADITARKKSDQALKEKEANYRAIFDAANDAIFVHDLATGDILDANRKVTEMYGYHTHEIKRLNIMDLSDGHPPFTQEKALEMIRKAIEEGPQLFEWLAKDKQGKVFWVEVNLKRATIGGKDRILAVVRDINDRKRLEEERSQLSQRIQLLLESTDEGIFGLDESGACNLINRAALEMTGFTAEEIVGKNVHQLIHHSYPDGSHYPVENCPIYNAFKVGRGRRLDTEVFWRKNGEAFPVEYSAYPIVQDDQIRGTVVTFTDITMRKQAENELKVAKELGDSLNAINALINSTLDLDQIMKKVVVEAGKALDVDTASVALREGGHWKIGYVYGLPQHLVGSFLSAEENRHAHEVAASKKPLIIKDASLDERVSKDIVEKYQVKSIIATPLIIKDEVVGILRFVFVKHKIDYAEQKLDFVHKLAAAVSLAIENARLYEAERNIADTLQEALLTVPEHMEGIDFGYLYRSASIAARVGGDFYDIFELPKGRIGIVIGDVSGKGLEAATLTSLVKNTIKAYAYESESAAAVMARTNEIVRKAPTRAPFVTAFFGILDLSSGKLVYCSAGHPEAILKKATSKIMLLETSSPIIGAFPRVSFVDEEITLTKGDMLVFYTDGVIEARCDSLFFGEERLISFVRDLKPLSARDVTRAIFREVLRCTGGKLSDDIALLAVALAGNK